MSYAAVGRIDEQKHNKTPPQLQQQGRMHKNTVRIRERKSEAIKADFKSTIRIISSKRIINQSWNQSN